MDFKTMSNKAVLAEIGGRISRQRLNRNITQADLARRAGVSRIVVQRIESGSGSTFENLVRVLRILGLLDNLDVFVPDTGPSPIQLVELRGRERIRAAGKHLKKK